MSGTRINNYGAGDPNITALMVTNNLTFRGLCSASLTNYDTTDEPEIAAGSVVEVGGTLYEFQSDESIGGSPSDGLVYIKLIPAGAVVTAEFTNDAPAWRDDLQGWYQSAISVNRYLPFFMILGSGLYSGKRNFTVRAIAYIRDEKSSGTSGGTFTAGAWRTRDLNTIVTNDIGASLDSNQITLPAGKYEVYAAVPAVGVNGHQAKLYNVSDSITQIVGTNEYDHSTYPGSSRSIIRGDMYLDSAKVLELQHYSEASRSTFGFGYGSNFGEINIYSEITITRLF